MEKESRQRVVLKLGAVFTVGLLLFTAQFGVRSLWEVLQFFTMPFGMWGVFVRDAFFVIWFGLAVLMLASVGACIWSRRLVWISYILIAAYWFWTYIVVTLLSL